MGTNLSRNSKSGNEHGAEMESGKQFRSGEEDSYESLDTVDDLNHQKDSLKAGVKRMSEAIDEVFQDVNNDSNERVQDLEQRLQSMANLNKEHIKHLTRQLERHAKDVTKGREANEAVMAAVIDLVSTVNSYMTMLIRNVRKLKRLISEMESSQTGGGSDLYNYWRRNQSTRKQDLIYDVINDHQDVDAMLVQLIETEAHREELESDIVSVLVFWRDFYQLQRLSEEQDGLDKIEADVMAAADSVAYGLAQLNSNKKAYDTPQPA